MCTHRPLCPSATAPDHAAARVVARQDDLGWTLLCNGVIAFDDTGEILPDGSSVRPNRPAPRPRPASRRRALAGALAA